ETVLDTKVDERALARDANTVQNVKLGLLEGRRHFVLHDLDTGAVADCLCTIFERLNATNVKTNRGVELQSLAAGRGLGATEEHTDLLAQLVNKDRGGLRLVEATCDLTQSLRHEASLQA